MKLSLLPSELVPPDAVQTASSQITVLRPSEQPVYIERPPVFVFDPHNTGLGGGLAQGWTTPRTPMGYRRIRNARSIGQRLVVDTDGSIILDQILTTAEACTTQMDVFTNRMTSLAYEDTDVAKVLGGYASSRLDHPFQAIEEPVLSLMSTEPSNYGSWLFRVLPKLLFRKHFGGNIKVMCWCPLPWQKRMLNFFGVKDEDIIDVNLGSCYKLSEIYVPVNLNPFAYMSEETLIFYKETLARHGIQQRRDRLIYISRRSRAAAANFENVRNFIDEPSMIAALEGQGFEVVEPETRSFIDQVRLFASAAMVVGASGAGMFNTAFSAPGTGIVDIEAFPDWLYAHCNYFSSCGHVYGIAFGLADRSDPSPTHKRWSIDVPSTVRKVLQVRDTLL